MKARNFINEIDLKNEDMSFFKDLQDLDFSYFEKKIRNKMNVFIL